MDWLDEEILGVLKNGGELSISKIAKLTNQKNDIIGLRLMGSCFHLVSRSKTRHILEDNKRRSYGWKLKYPNIV